MFFSAGLLYEMASQISELSLATFKRSFWNILSILSYSVNNFLLSSHTGASVQKQRTVKKRKDNSLSSSSSFSKKRKPVVSGDVNNVNYNRYYFS